MIHPVYTKHFAKRWFERIGMDMELLNKVKREIDKNFCEIIFDCVLYGNHQRREYEGVKVTFCFEEEQRKLMVTSVYTGRE